MSKPLQILVAGVLTSPQAAQGSEILPEQPPEAVLWSGEGPPPSCPLPLAGRPQAEVRAPVQQAFPSPHLMMLAAAPFQFPSDLPLVLPTGWAQKGQGRTQSSSAPPGPGPTLRAGPLSTGQPTVALGFYGACAWLFQSPHPSGVLSSFLSLHALSVQTH